MKEQQTFNIAVFPGDGIGPEITAPCCHLLTLACDRANQMHDSTEASTQAGSEAALKNQANASTTTIGLRFTELAAGAQTYAQTSEALPASSIKAARSADAILLSAMGDPAIRYPDGTEITPQIDLRFELGLYAGLRPVRSIPGVPGPLADPRAQGIDFVLVRESIEGLFAPQAPGKMLGDEQAEETLVITRKVSEKLFDATFDLAIKRAKDREQSHNYASAGARAGATQSARITCIDKANVFQAFAFFRKLFYEAATRAEIKTDKVLHADHAYVDIMSLNLVTQPWNYDVMVTENMFGDILSDLGAALIGGMGYAPSADIGDEFAVFQPCHGTAPDIAGKGLANPTAMFLSGAMMLDWLADQHQHPRLKTAARLLTQAVDDAFAPGSLKTVELGGTSGLDEVSKAVEKALTNAN